LEKLKMNRDLDNLTPLDARNSLLMDPSKMPHFDNDPKHPLMKKDSEDSFMREPANPYSGATPLQTYRHLGPVESQENLVSGAAPLGGRGISPPRQQPTIPNINFSGYTGYRGAAY
jgi:hypothetical protein